MNFDEQILKSRLVNNFRATIISTVFICCSVMGAYYGIKADIQTVRSSNQFDIQNQAARISITELQIKTLQIRVDKLEYEVNQLKDDDFSSKNKAQ